MQESNMLKKGIQITKEKELYYISAGKNEVMKFKPWLGDSFLFLYDFIMKRSIFPRKFGGDMNKHYAILSQELKDVHGKRVLELATGSGSAVNFLPNDNRYTGTDISPGLLTKAAKNFRTAGFKNAEFYVARADDLPFEDNVFDIVLCILSLNFFKDVGKAIREIRRVVVPDAVYICSVPVPERNKLHSTIRGRLYSEKELAEICGELGFSYQRIPSDNGALIYFRAIPK
jgi:ubiquinone/menaquinone biosynthesis C-methylase UbiE